MSRFKTFIIFTGLVAIWASFFSGLKYYLWGELWNTINPDLQKIAGFLSLGSVFAYLVWGAFASTFLKKYYLFIISIFSFLLVSFWYVFWFATQTFFAVIITLIWFLYWLWNVIKSVIISIEIKKTWLAETLVNAIVWITFVVFLIFWSILGSILFEQLGHNGYLVLMFMLFAIWIISFLLDYEKISFSSLIKDGWGKYLLERKGSLKKSLSAYLPDIKYILKNYLLIILTSSFLWTISTIVSQITIEFSVERFWISASKATYILLYCALWAIIWNILSIKMNIHRWKYFIIFNSLFWIMILIFPILGQDFTKLSIMAGILWIFFGISSNLVDSYMLKSFWDQNKKEYWASTFGLIFSSILFCMMIMSSFLLSIFWYTTIMLILWAIILIVWIILYKKQLWK